MAEKYPPVAQLPPVTTDDRKALLIKSNDPTEEQLALMGPGQAPGWLFRTAAGAERDIISLEERTALEADGPPPYLLMRFSSVISEKIRDRLLCAWDDLNDLGLELPKPDPQRSSSAAAHLGVWGIRGNGGLRVTGDSQQKSIKDPKQRAEVIAAMDHLLGIIKNEVVPKLHALINRHAPNQRRLQKRYVNSSHS
jgi:hypothetical protein